MEETTKMKEIFTEEYSLDSERSKDRRPTLEQMTLDRMVAMRKGTKRKCVEGLERMFEDIHLKVLMWSSLRSYQKGMKNNRF